MKFLIAFVMAVVVITYPIKIVIQNAESLAARDIPIVQQHIEQIPETFLPLVEIVSPNLLEENKQITCLAKNIYFEAAIESTAGKLAVAHVTNNRVDSRYFPNSYCDVIYEGNHWANGLPKRNQCQFSWYCDGRHDIPFPGPTWSRVQDLASYYYANAKDLRDITDGAKFYHADYIDSPRWSMFKKKTVQIDTHIFYR